MFNNAVVYDYKMGQLRKNRTHKMYTRDKYVTLLKNFLDELR